MDMYRDLNLKYDKLREFKKECENMATLCSGLIEKRKSLIEYSCFSDWDKNRLIAKYNPEDYYSFKLFDKGVSIVYTNYKYDEKMGKSVRSHNYSYSIKYYNCRSKVFTDNRSLLPFINDNSSYGSFESLDVAISYFRRAVVDLLVQFGNCRALSPMDFF